MNYRTPQEWFDPAPDRDSGVNYRTPQEWFDLIPDPGAFIQLKPGLDFDTGTHERVAEMLLGAAESQGFPLQVKFGGHASRRFIRISQKSRPSNAIYPWDLWMNGRVHRLLPGVDFRVTPQALRGMAYTVAKRRGVRIRFKDTPEVFLIQTYRPDPKVPPWDFHWPAVGSETETPQEVPNAEPWTAT